MGLFSAIGEFSSKFFLEVSICDSYSGNLPGWRPPFFGPGTSTVSFGNKEVILCSKRSYYYCARKRNGLLLRSENAVVPLRSETQWFFVLTPVVTGARNPQKVLFKGDWSQSQ